MGFTVEVMTPALLTVIDEHWRLKRVRIEFAEEPGASAVRFSVRTAVRTEFAGHSVGAVRSLSDPTTGPSYDTPRYS